MLSNSLRRNPRTLVARIVMPMATALVVLLALAIGALLWTGSRANDLALERQRGQIAAALLGERRQSLRDLAQMAAEPALGAELSEAADGTPPQDNPAAALLAPSPFAAAFVITPADRLLLGATKDAAAGQAQLDRMLPLFQTVLAKAKGQAMLAAADGSAPGTDVTPEALARTGATQLLAAPSGPLIVAALTLPAAATQDNPDARRYALAARLLDADRIHAIGLAYGAPDMHFAPWAPNLGDARHGVSDEAGALAGAFVWTPDKPGDLVLDHVFPVILAALGAIALFCALMFRHVRAIAIEFQLREAQATHLAHHDPLSGLPNRALFAKRLDDELERLERGGDALAVLYLDLDRFKDINDSHGHQAGDAVIRAVARRLSDLLRGADTLARFGGDEFAIIQTGVREPRDSESLARRILEAVRQAVPLAEGEAYVGVSIGIALAPENATSRESLMRLADIALYRAKHEGRNRYTFFETVMDETLKLRKIVEDDLRIAIERDQLELRYQPQMSADGRRILGVEALVRWNHPRRGLIPPSDFIPIAEERGLIGPLGEWVLRRAARTGRRWRDITVAVNVSPIQFRHKDFVATVSRILDEEGLDPSRLELELTEGVVVEDADGAENAMIELRSLGVRMALDDFGTGYSSLIYLRRFAFDKIKIDRSFLEAMETTGESAILMHSVVHLGRALGLTVTAEGVETEEQQRFLQAAGCHQLQGYLFCEPVSADHIDRLLAAPALRGASEAA